MLRRPRRTLRQGRRIKTALGWRAPVDSAASKSTPAKWPMPPREVKMPPPTNLTAPRSEIPDSCETAGEPARLLPATSGDRFPGIAGQRRRTEPPPPEKQCLSRPLPRFPPPPASHPFQNPTDCFGVSKTFSLAHGRYCKSLPRKIHRLAFTSIAKFAPPAAMHRAS